MDTVSIMIVGVGGQGTLLASRVIGDVLLARGYDVKLSEVHRDVTARRFCCDVRTLRRKGLLARC